MASPKYLAGILAAVYVFLLVPGMLPPSRNRLVNEGFPKGIDPKSYKISNPSGNFSKKSWVVFVRIPICMYTCIHILYMYTCTYIYIDNMKTILGPQLPTTAPVLNRSVAPGGFP